MAFNDAPQQGNDRTMDVLFGAPAEAPKGLDLLSLSGKGPAAAADKGSESAIASLMIKPNLMPQTYGESVMSTLKEPKGEQIIPAMQLTGPVMANDISRKPDPARAAGIAAADAKLKQWAA